jgi:hypothetical protein
VWASMLSNAAALSDVSVMPISYGRILRAS